MRDRLPLTITCAETGETVEVGTIEAHLWNAVKDIAARNDVTPDDITNGMLRLYCDGVSPSEMATMDIHDVVAAGKVEAGRELLTLNLPPETLEGLRAIQFVTGKSMEVIALEFLAAANDRATIPAELLGEAIKRGQSESERREIVKRFKAYRDHHKLDFPDGLIDLSIDEVDGKVDYEQWGELLDPARGKAVAA